MRFYVLNNANFYITSKLNVIISLIRVDYQVEISKMKQQKVQIAPSIDLMVPPISVLCCRYVTDTQIYA